MGRAAARRVAGAPGRGARLVAADLLDEKGILSNEPKFGAQDVPALGGAARHAMRGRRLGVAALFRAVRPEPGASR